LKKKNSIPSIQVIPDGIYPCNIYVFRGYTLDQARSDLESIASNYENIVDDKVFTSPGHTVRFSNGSVIIVLHEDHINDIGIIVHEAFHATEFILEYAHIKHSDETSEVYAYLLQYIVNEIMK